MDESQIAAKQRENIPQAEPQQPVEGGGPTPNTDQTTIKVDSPIEPMLGYKLSDVLGISYDPMDTDQADMMKFVFDEASKSSPTGEYTDVAKYIKDLVYMLGAQTTKNPLYTVYQWMKLDSNRKKIEEEMKLYTNWSVL